MQSQFSLRYLLTQPLVRDAIYKHLTPLDQRTVDLSLDEEWMSRQQFFFVDPAKPDCCQTYWPLFRRCAYLLMDGIVETICANPGNVKIYGFMASTSMELEEHRIGLKHTNCALRTCFLPPECRNFVEDHVRVTVYHRGYDRRTGNVYAEMSFDQQLAQYLQTRLPHCEVNIVANDYHRGKAYVHVRDQLNNIDTRVSYRVFCESVYIMPTCPMLFRRSVNDWFHFQSNNNMFCLAHTLTWRFYDSCGRQYSDWQRLALLQTGIAATEPMYRKQLKLRKCKSKTTFHPALRSTRSFVNTCWTHFEAVLTQRNNGKPLYDYVALLPCNMHIRRRMPQIYLNDDACDKATASTNGLSKASAVSSSGTGTTAASTAAALCRVYCLRTSDYEAIDNLALIAEPPATFQNQPLILPVTKSNQLALPFYPPCDTVYRKIRQMLENESFNKSSAW